MSEDDEVRQFGLPRKDLEAGASFENKPARVRRRIQERLDLLYRTTPHDLHGKRAFQRMVSLVKAQELFDIGEAALIEAEYEELRGHHPEPHDHMERG